MSETVNAEGRIQKYKAWLLAPGVTNIRQEAADLQAAITSRCFNATTFEDLIVLLNHEYLCVKLGQDSSVVLAAATFVNLKPSLEVSFLDGLLEVLCGRWTRSLGDFNLVERELQFRALLATFALLYSRGVSAFTSEYHDKLRTMLEALFKELHWTPVDDGLLTHKKYLKTQCSFLLSTINEYFARFGRAEPRAVTRASRAISFLSFGVSLSSSAMGMGAPNLQQALIDLNNSLKAVSHQPNERFSGLFTVQEFTRLAQALELLNKAIEGTLTPFEIAQKIRERLNQFTTETLINVTSAIAQFPNYENEATPPGSTRSSVLAVTSHGPPRFNTFQYLFGLLDSAIQVGRIANIQNLPHTLNVRLRAVALEGNVSEHRWKALDYTLSCSTAFVEFEADSLREECRPEFIARLQHEISVLCPKASADCTSSSSNSRTSSSTTSHYPSIGDKPSSQDWREPTFNSPDFDQSCTKQTVTTNASRRSSFLSVGLSPDCNAIYTLKKNSICVYSLYSNDRHELVRHENEDKDWSQAALSDKYVATMSRDELHVIAYDQIKTANNHFTKVAFRNNRQSSIFQPRCLAILDKSEKTWIAVAGEHSNGSLTGGRSGVIRVYTVSEINNGMAVAETGVSFNVSTTDSLRGALIKYLDFCPSGDSMVAVTSDNAVLVWSVSGNMQPCKEPFRISRNYELEPAVRGLTSATIFQGPSTRSYVLCTTWPSSRRAENGGEWSYVSPVSMKSCQPPDRAVHDIVNLRKAGPIVAGAASPGGEYVALLERNGEVIVFPLKASGNGGLRSLEGLRLTPHRLKSQDEVNAAAIRFRNGHHGLELFVVDNSGQMLHKRFEGPQTLGPECAHHPSATAVVVKSGG